MSSPHKSFHQSPALERSIALNHNRLKVKRSKFWCCVNVAMWSALVYDIYNTTVYDLQYFHFCEYVLLAVFTANILYYLMKIIITPTKSEQILITREQKVLLGIKDADSSFKVVDKLPSTPPYSQSPNKQSSVKASFSPVTPATLSTTPINMTSSWRSNVSQNESLNYSMPSPSWTYHPGSPVLNQSSLQQTSPVWLPQKTSDTEFIRDEKSLDKYLKSYETVEKVNNLNTTPPQSSNLLSSFWSHPVTKTAKDMSMFLRRCQYQLSSQSPANTSTSSPSSKQEEKGSPVNPYTTQTTGLEVWTRINVDSVALTQWNENLRKWLSQTILERLVKEFDLINEALEKKCMTDIKIGSVGLDRLRKTAHMMPVAQVVPSLAMLISFLEVHANQEYVVKRIRELTKGGCMSEFKWNAGSSYNGKEWDDSLPTDCAIIMHLLGSYLDTQLMPVPNMPDMKPFSGHYYIKYGDKMPTLTFNSLYIQNFSEKSPHYRVIVGEKIYEMVKGYNNLFHSILFFLYHANKMECGMLGRVNLGRAGLNMLWIIGEQ